MLFIIYLDRLIGRYEAKLREELSIDRPILTTRNEQAGYKWCRPKELARFRIKGEIRTSKPILQERWIAEISNDTHAYADDLTVKSTGPY